MTIKHLFPEAWPTLNLDFANELALDPRITFSRSSVGTYVDKNGIIQYAAEDEPRFDHDPVTGESMGLLIEESRTNLITYSEDLADSSWFKFNSPTVSNSVMASPKGDSSVSTIEQTTSSQQLLSAQYLTLTVGQQYTFSCFAKSGNHDWLRLGHVTSGTTGCWFDLENGVMGTVNSDGASMTAYPNGWYRITNTFTAAVSTSTPTGGVSQLAFICLSSDDGSTTPSAAIGQNVHVWGVQLTEASFPSSYISTSGAAEDRAADNCTIEGDSISSWYNPSESTFVAKYTCAYGSAQAAVFGANDGTNNNVISLRPRNTFAKSSGVNQFNVSLYAGATPPNVQDTIGFSLDSFGAYLVNTNASDSDITSVTMPVGMNQLKMGKVENASIYLNGHIARLAYYPRRLSDEQLQALTS